MKKALLALAAVMMTASAYAQANGNIIFANRNIPTASGTGGGNGNGTYNVPIWEFNATPGVQTGNGAGDLPGGVTVGLFQTGGTAPLATSLLRTDANSQFFATAATPVDVPGVAPGQSTTLIVRAWTTANGSFDAAKNSTTGQWGEWSFTTRPLGGTPPTPGSTPVPTPNMTGWGPEDGTGLELNAVPEPSTIALGVLGIGAVALMRRRK